MSSNASQLFDVFVEAKSALEELPKVKADLEAAQQLIDETQRKFTEALNDGADKAYELQQLKTHLAAREAELARVTFQHQTLRAAIGSINDTVRSVSDRPVSEPVPEPVPQPVASAASTEQGQSVTDPTVAAAEPMNTATGASGIQAEGTDRPLAPENASGSDNPNAMTTTGLSRDAGATAGTPSPTPSEDREPLGEGRTSASTTEDVKAHGGAQPIADVGTAQRADKPYLGWGSHRKPHNVTWGEFERLGGYRPHWCNPDLT